MTEGKILLAPYSPTVLGEIFKSAATSRAANVVDTAGCPRSECLTQGGALLREALRPRGASVDQRRYFAVMVRGGLVARVRMFSDRADALEAAGLPA